uniref:Possible Fe-S oxidoreductase n=1 Tax=Paulinella chromatophora TaxID=39717 RepID=B1X455_PAUCH|nr:possible Fe-S oxidoreductase [Paulinella chromatophora]ACB42724.1 possible Fe-S oxidoreductase [Paulinella chromatophora]
MSKTFSDGVVWTKTETQHPLQEAVVNSVEADSIGDRFGLEIGDCLMSINGKRPRDTIDFQILTSEEDISIVVRTSDQSFSLIELEKDLDEGMGLGFTEALFDGIKQCNNHCSFCFIDQQPSGYRNSLYVKDDDFRLSFLYGSYLTLTNLTIFDWQRIEYQRLSPLYLSIHATDPELRSHLLINSRGSLIMSQLRWFADRQLQIHAQVVICPGFNDGPALQRTLIELSNFTFGDIPAVISIAIVPVGLTRFRSKEDKLISVDLFCANRVIDQVERLQMYFYNTFSSRCVWLSDEWYLIGHRPFPPSLSYEDFPQQENGVGSIRAFLKDLDKSTHQLPKRITKQRRFSWIVGHLVADAIKPAIERLNNVEGLELILYGLPSRYWGQEQIVTGLLTGSDLLSGLQNKDLGDAILIPSILLKDNKQIFLDEITLESVQQVLPVPIQVVSDVTEIISLCIGMEI